MIHIGQVQGAIFDMDDTLLDNGPVDKPQEWLHARSRLAAVYEIAEKYDIVALRGVTLDENARAFVTAKVHSLQGGIWNIFYMRGLVDSDEIDTTNPYYPLIQEIAARKNELHADILREFGAEIPGSSDFVRTLAMHDGLRDHIAMATSAVRRDIDMYLSMTGLAEYFPDDRVISDEKVSRPKPDPECFELAFRSLNLPDSARRSVLAFEDNPRGMLSAKQAGLYVCAITTRLKRDDPALLAAEPDVIADSYAEFSQLLNMQPV
jgi:beta-phosphoglucomutase-like phosphatase (HAD superfamily)